MKLTVIGLSITSSWGNGHATTFRALLKQFHKLGHEITFLEKDVDYYARHRDLPEPDFCRVVLYKDLHELKYKCSSYISKADAVMVGSYVPEGVEVINWMFGHAKGVTMFYDIDTPVTFAKLDKQDYEYLMPDQIQNFDMYLSFTGGPMLGRIMEDYNSPIAKPLYCSVDVDLYYPEDIQKQWQMGYLGTYSSDRQPTVEKLLNKPAAEAPDKIFVVAGPQYPLDYEWAPNVMRIDHLPPTEHRFFYNSQCFTLNVTRKDMIDAGYSPSVRLFEAAACGVPIISDYWDGIETFFKRDTEILIADSADDVTGYFKDLSEEERKAIGERARQRILQSHTSSVRALQLEDYINELRSTLDKK